MTKKSAQKAPGAVRKAAFTSAKPEKAASRERASLDLAAPLFDRVAAILDAARSSVVRAVNSSMVIAYWLIGREIVQELQGGDDRAGYGRNLVEQLADQLTARFGRGFSTTNLRYFRTFFLTYSARVPEIRHIGCGESSDANSKRHIQGGVLADLLAAVEQIDAERGFSDRLGWSHYRALMKVEHQAERLFYEIEAASSGWDVATLDRQIHTFLFARLLKSRDKAGVLALATEGQALTLPIDAIKDPYVLDFLHLPESEKLHERGLESAIIGTLQSFLLELGKGFAFIARQKRMAFGDQFFYVDLVFYHCILKCYVLIDLKIGPLTHQDIGQMDSYVRMWDDLGRSTGDNPTIGLLLCTEKSETIARYSVLKESQQLFASKYRLHLPTEEELAAELNREVLAIKEGRGR